MTSEPMPLEVLLNELSHTPGIDIQLMNDNPLKTIEETRWHSRYISSIIKDFRNRKRETENGVAKYGCNNGIYLTYVCFSDHGSSELLVVGNEELEVSIMRGLEEQRDYLRMIPKGSSDVFNGMLTDMGLKPICYRKAGRRVEIPEYKLGERDDKGNLPNIEVLYQGIIDLLKIPSRRTSFSESF